MQRVRAAARELMWSKGYDEVTTKELALRADIGEATLFRYVPSKVDLFLLVYGERFGEVLAGCERVEERLRGEPGTAEPRHYRDRILAMYTHLGRLYEEFPELAYAYVRDSFSARSKIAQEGLAQGDRWLALTEGILSQGQAAGALSAEVDPEIFAQNCHAAYVHEVIRTHGRGLPTESTTDRLSRRLAALVEPLYRD